MNNPTQRHGKVMDDKLDIKQALAAVGQITRHGQPGHHQFEYGGLWVDSDFDGYGLTLGDAQVSLDIYFHSSYQLHSPNRFATEAFIEHVEALARHRH